MKKGKKKENIKDEDINLSGFFELASSDGKDINRLKLHEI